MATKRELVHEVNRLETRTSWSFSRKFGLPKSSTFLADASSMSLTATTSTVLGKRKSRKQDYVLQLASSPEPQDLTAPSDSDFEPAPTKAAPRPLLINGTLVSDTKKRYKCTFEGCDKAYAKPSRLEEHERSHTGEVSSGDRRISVF